LVVKGFYCNHSISDITVRRDLLILNKAGLIKRIYGGATLPEQFLKEPVFFSTYKSV